MGSPGDTELGMSAAPMTCLGKPDELQLEYCDNRSLLRCSFVALQAMQDAVELGWTGR
ncbi:hypothetical protein [Cerasicoccus arenae]|uniref:hypothetical protein n=1 Tax=Cerasicoccus arenae TaxID=424488 RepID=UPI00167A319F|nr:hypothetical protein [Cerasicoccus arenae]MBK1859976.1 hypothetical protein [Cerasicoccus arenae]